MVAQVALDRFGDELRTEEAGGELVLFVEFADFMALGVVEDREVDGFGEVVFGEFGGATDVDDFGERGEVLRGRDAFGGFHVVFYKRKIGGLNRQKTTDSIDQA